MSNSMWVCPQGVSLKLEKHVKLSVVFIFTGPFLSSHGLKLLQKRNCPFYLFFLEVVEKSVDSLRGLLTPEANMQQLSLAADKSK